jgi:CO/xanthine dehydrogenase Mo-binding subunit
VIDARVTGTQRYSVHVERPGMLHAAFVRSPHAHARVTGVDASGLPAGCVALLPEDVADIAPYGCQARDQRVLADVARHAGDIVAAVAAPTPAAARAAARAIEVAYAELPAVFDAV